MLELAPTFPAMGAAWTHGAKLPGGDVPVAGFADWADGVARRYSFLDRSLIARLCRAYGSRIDVLLAGVSRATDLGRDFGAGLSEREVEYLVAHEWAESAEDILWRRSKLGLHMTPAERAAFADHLAGGRVAAYAQSRGQVS
jgi:glycerol-3-phosphate dehydrogenase